jgi:hypothetical protein
LKDFADGVAVEKDIVDVAIVDALDTLEIIEGNEKDTCEACKK